MNASPAIISSAFHLVLPIVAVQNAQLARLFCDGVLGVLWVGLFQVFQRQDLFRMSDR